MRKIIAAFRVSVDGFIEGPNGEGIVDTWDDAFDLVPQIDTCVLGGGMYPQYEQYWGTIVVNPAGTLPFTGKVATKGEIDYSLFASRTPHVVLSTTMQRVGWKNTCIVRDIEDIRNLKQQPGKDIYAVGGPTFASSLMNRGLIDELRLIVVPVVLGSGKALFRSVSERHPLELLETRTLQSGLVRLRYRWGDRMA